MKVEEIITQQILDYIKTEGEIPWKQPWMRIFPKNYAGNNEYHGVNFFLLMMATRKNKWQYPYLVTYKQAKNLGGAVKTDELKNGNIIVFQKQWFPKNQPTEDEDGNELKPRSFWVLRYYRVFNIEQCDGLEMPKGNGVELNEAYDDVLKSYKDIPSIVHNGNRAYYNPVEDKIAVPPVQQFKDSVSYYATLYHELTHSTGAEHRLARFKKTDKHIFGDETYSKEELVAELGSAFLCARHNIDNSLIKNSAGYIKNWLKVLENNPKWIVSASSKAQKSVDYMLNGKKKNTKKSDNSDN